MKRRNRMPAKSRTHEDGLAMSVNVGRHEHSRNDVRRTIAYSAARLIAEGLTDYQAARHKAARQHGVTNRHGLPDNREIDLALREHHSLFARKTQPDTLRVLRSTAIRLMTRFAQFAPWLTGAVLNGTANEFSKIELELIGVEPKEFELYLINAGVEFELGVGRHATEDTPTSLSPVIEYRLEFDSALVAIALYDHHAARQAVHTRASIGHDRVQRADAERRFLEAASIPADGGPHPA